MILVRKRDSGKLYAMKLIEKEFIKNKKKVSLLMSERRIMETLSSPFIVKLK